MVLPIQPENIPQKPTGKILVLLALSTGSGISHADTSGVYEGDADPGLGVDNDDFIEAGSSNVSGLEALKDADLLFIFARFLNLPENPHSARTHRTFDRLKTGDGWGRQHNLKDPPIFQRLCQFMFVRPFLFLALASPLFAQEGKLLFATYCSACHGLDGKGAAGGDFPPLAGSPWITGDGARPVKLVLKGLTGPVEVLGRTYNLEMPPQGAVVNDEQIAAIFTYVRSSWGNQEKPITAEFVKQVRASVESRKTPWTAPEILQLHPLPLEKTALKNLISQVFPGKWNALPDFSGLKAANVEEEHDGILRVSDAPLKDHFGMVWTAEFHAPKSGEYIFRLDADDGARVLIDGTRIAEINGIGPMNGGRAKVGKVQLSAGSHPFRVEYFEGLGEESIALAWKGPGAKQWRWLSDQPAEGSNQFEPIPVLPEDGWPVIYRNFIAGTTPRAIGVGFPGGLNLAYSADHFAPELLWTGDFINGAPKWIERGTENNPPAGDDVVAPSKERALPEGARFRGYKLDSEGNPTFSSQLGSGFVLDSWRAVNGALVRKLALTGETSPVDILISDHPLGDQIDLQLTGGQLQTNDGRSTLKLAPGQPVIITYRWKN